MKKVDYLFVYETKVRELENICLLRYELEKKGYSVDVINTWYYLDKKIPKIKAKVVVCHALRNDGIFDFIKTYASGHIDKIINMQCEQIGKQIDEENRTPVLIYSGAIANQAVHLSWGENNKNRLINECGFDSSKVFITGHVTLDFGRKEFRNYYLSREQLFEKYGIPNTTKVYLFTSSFVYVNLPNNIIEDVKRYTKNDLFQQISIESFNKVVEWINKALRLYPDCVFIYRPHPAEANNPKLMAFQAQEQRFFVIDELSVKQWIVACDKVYTWLSTSIAEAYAFGKPCEILRPVEIPNSIDSALFRNANFICNENEFLESISKEGCMGLSVDIFHEYYHMDSEMPAYKKIVDVMENVYNNDKFRVNDTRKRKSVNPLLLIRHLTYKCVQYIVTILGIEYKIFSKYQNRTEIDDYTRQLQDRNYAASHEINNTVNRIRNLLD